MDLGTVVTAAIMLAVCVLPFVLMNQKKKKHIKHLKQTFNNFVNEHKQTIEVFETCGEVAIGFSTDSSHLFFVKEHNTSTVKVCLDMKNISGVSIEKIFLNDSSSFDKLGLTFNLKGNTLKLTQLIFFDCDDKRQLDGELQLVEKWQQLIQATI